MSLLAVSTISLWQAAAVVVVRTARLRLMQAEAVPVVMFLVLAWRLLWEPTSLLLSGPRARAGLATQMGRLAEILRLRERLRLLAADMARLSIQPVQPVGQAVGALGFQALAVLEPAAKAIMVGLRPRLAATAVAVAVAAQVLSGPLLLRAKLALVAQARPAPSVDRPSHTAQAAAVVAVMLAETRVLAVVRLRAMAGALSMVTPRAQPDLEMAAAVRLAPAPATRMAAMGVRES